MVKSEVFVTVEYTWSNFNYFQQQKNPYSKILVAKNIMKKLSRNILFFYLGKLSRFWGQFSSSALAQSNILH